jgi:uncharacterized protein DUF3300
VIRRIISAVCILALVPGNTVLRGQTTPPNPPATESGKSTSPASSSTASEQETVKLPPEQLDSLVAPIALYPDPLLSQTLVASTYPLELVQLKQWLDKNKGLKEKELAEAVKKQNWDPSIQALAALPDVVKRLSEDIKWTTDLGNAFLAQQGDVMDAVQRMRKKAQETGNLKSSEQQKVETKVVENKQVIVVQQANPEVVYVPTYNPTVVYGPPVYPYPPVYYPPPGYYAAGMAISFGVGIAMGAAWGGGWGWNCGWGGHNNVYINNNNNFVRSYNRQNVSNINRNVSNRTGNTWQHNPQHRGGAPYSDRATARQYGGTARGDSMANRQQNARQSLQTNRQNGGAGTRSNSTGRPQQAAMRESAGSANRQAGGTGNRSSSGNGDRVGNRSVSSDGGSRSSSAFSGGGGFSGSGARSSSSRGASSMGGGGARRGGGGGRRR